MMSAFGVLTIPLVVLLVAALKSFGINQEYERAVVFRLGRIKEPKGPGWYWLIPFIDRAVRVDMRTLRSSPLSASNATLPVMSFCQNSRCSSRCV